MEEARKFLQKNSCCLFLFLVYFFISFKQVEVYPIFSTILQLFAQVMEYP